MTTYGAMNRASFGDLNYEAQIKALKALKALRPISENYNALVKEWGEKNNRKEISDEALFKAVNDETERKVEVELEQFTEDEMRKIISTNKLKGAELLALDDVMAEHKDTAKK